MGKPALARIKSIAAELQSLRKIPKRYHVDLVNRCILIWGKPRDNPDSAYGARERKAASREKQAQATYRDVQDENCHILLPFMLAMSPRACEGFEEMQEMTAEYVSFRLNLGIESKELLEEIAAENEFNKNADYIRFIESLFSAQQTEGLDDFELIQRIIQRRGLLEHPTCIEFLNFMFPDEHSESHSIIARGPMAGHANNLSAQSGRLIEYRCSGVPISLIELVGAPIYEAIQLSKQWKWERNTGGPTTDCMNALVPHSASEDISFTFTLGHQVGLRLIDEFKMMTIW